MSGDLHVSWHEYHTLIERLAQESKIPMIKHLDGVCHVYVDTGANHEKALRVADNAKTQRYATCNTMETLLVARVGDAVVGRHILGEILSVLHVEAALRLRVLHRDEPAVARGAVPVAPSRPSSRTSPRSRRAR